MEVDVQVERAANGAQLMPHNMALLVQDALLAAEELEKLREAYKKKVAAEEHG